MKHELKKLDKSMVEIKITVLPAEYQKDLEAAAVRLSERAAIKGFRPGKAPYNAVKEQLGEVKIFEEALQTIVEMNYFRAVQAEKIETIGQPEITIEKMAPNNEFVFIAKVALLPKIELADITKIKVERKAKEITDKEVDNVANDLRKMQTKETIKNGQATKDDKVVIDMDMFVNNVPMEGGQAKGYQVYLNEPHYVEGLADQLVGLKKDDTKDFTLKFPKDHYDKNYAGRDVDFKVKVHDVFELQAQAFDDTFAKSLGQESAEKLKGLLRDNLIKESEHKEDQRVEGEILEKLIAESKFEEIPEVLINSEKQKMFYELKHDLEHRGIAFEKYLKDIKKTEEQIYNDFTENATKRAKAALVSRQVAKDNNIEISDEELKKEIDLIKTMYDGEELKRVEENIKRQEVKDTIAISIQNRKVMDWLKEKILGEKPKTEDKHEHGHSHGAPGHKCDHC